MVAKKTRAHCRNRRPRLGFRGSRATARDAAGPTIGRAGGGTNGRGPPVGAVLVPGRVPGTVARVGATAAASASGGSGGGTVRRVTASSATAPSRRVCGSSAALAGHPCFCASVSSPAW